MQEPTLLGCGGRLRPARRRVRHPGGHCELRLAVRNSRRTPATAVPVTPRTRAQPSSSRGAGVSKAGSGSTEEQGARPHVLQTNSPSADVATTGPLRLSLIWRAHVRQPLPARELTASDHPSACQPQGSCTDPLCSSPSSAYNGRVCSLHSMETSCAARDRELAILVVWKQSKGECCLH